MATSKLKPIMAISRTKPICSICESEGKKYNVYEGGATRTLMNIIPAFWDEEGNYHPSVDPNKTSIECLCSNGHSWKEILY